MNQQERELIRTVRKMRASQIAYFKTKNQTALNEAKRLERVVDMLLLNVDENRDPVSDLFN